jgi:hypothetical protein
MSGKLSRTYRASCSLNSADDRDQDARSDEAGNQIADPTGEVNAEEAEQPASCELSGGCPFGPGRES